MRKRKLKKKNETEIKEKVSLLTTGLTEEWYFILRCIAILSMIIDHLGWFLADNLARNPYLMLRGFGRIAFPIFVFLLIESFYHTKDKKAHLYRLFFLAILSEIPFDYFVSGRVIAPEIQNVILALSFYFMYLWVCEKIRDSSLMPFRMKEKDKKGKTILKIGFIKIKEETVMLLVKFDLAVLLYIFCEVCQFDYAGQGVVLLFLLDFARGRKHFFLWQIFAFCTFIVCREERINLMALIGLVPMFVAQLSFFKTKRLTRVRLIARNEIVKVICRYFYPIHFLVFLATYITKGV